MENFQPPNVPEDILSKIIVTNAVSEQETLRKKPLHDDAGKGSLPIPLNDLSKEHRVMVTFIKFLGCPMCQVAIINVSRMLPAFLKINVIPVIAVQEKESYARGFFNKLCSKEPNVSSLLMISDVSKEIQSAFKIESRSMTDHFRAMTVNLGAMFQGYSMSIPHKSVANPFIDFGLFLVEQCKVIKSFPFKVLGERPDYGKFVMLMQSESLDTTKVSGILSTINDIAGYTNKLKSLFPNLSELLLSSTKEDTNKFHNLEVKCTSSIPPSSSVSTTSSESDKCPSFESKNEKRLKLELADVMTRPFCRSFLKAYALNEHSVENLLFFDEIEIFKVYPSIGRANSMIKLFLEDNSLYAVNVNKKQIDIVKERLLKENIPIEENSNNHEESSLSSSSSSSLKNITSKSTNIPMNDKAPGDLFDNIAQDLLCTVIGDTFSRFSNSYLFQEMIAHMESKSYVIQPRKRKYINNC